MPCNYGRVLVVPLAIASTNLSGLSNYELSGLGVDTLGDNTRRLQQSICVSFSQSCWSDSIKL